MMTSQMDKARKTKDKAYKNVFKGSVLISSLIEQDEKKFKDREAAVKVSTGRAQAHNHSYLAHSLIAVYKLYDVLKSTITISARTDWTKYGNEKITKIVLFFLLFLIFEGTLKSDDVVTQSSNACVYVTRP